ncbi:response regulator [Fulvivirga ulvae]|uniref:response regulator n=1 Tax=Fulvivirga ulvae TaxID=2904245 RepID=UPI001F1ABCEF|nr:response regulator [Fulvivirga ulvae]UII32872.1 response regulator [Fulvivirga ulvae]
MSKKLDYILLADDDKDCNFYHKRVLSKMDITQSIHVANDGQEALTFILKDKNPEDRGIIFLDINMPIMDGWEFLEEYEKLENRKKSNDVLIVLTTSLNPDDKDRAVRQRSVDDYYNKYLKRDAVNKILREHFFDMV